MPTSNTDHCFDSVPTVLVDGANGVCRRPEPRSDLVAPMAMVLWVALFVGAMVWLAWPRAMRRRGVWLIAMACALAVSVPGLVHVWVRRADAPAHLAETAGTIERFASQVERFSTAHDHCVAIVQRGCIACTPVLRYARPTPRECVAPHARILIEDGALVHGCIDRGDTLACGGAP